MIQRRKFLNFNLCSLLKIILEHDASNNQADHRKEALVESPAFPFSKQFEVILFQCLLFLLHELLFLLKFILIIWDLRLFLIYDANLLLGAFIFRILLEIINQVGTRVPRLRLRSPMTIINPHPFSLNVLPVF